MVNRDTFDRHLFEKPFFCQFNQNGYDIQFCIQLSASAILV